MNGKNLADRLFKAFDEGKAGNEPELVGEMVPALAALSTDEMWRFVFAAAATDRTRTDREKFVAFNAAANGHPEFAIALKAMQAAPRPAELAGPQK